MELESLNVLHYSILHHICQQSYVQVHQAQVEAWTYSKGWWVRL